MENVHNLVVTGTLNMLVNKRNVCLTVWLTDVVSSPLDFNITRKLIASVSLYLQTGYETNWSQHWIYKETERTIYNEKYEAHKKSLITIT